MSDYKAIDFHFNPPPKRDMNRVRSIRADESIAPVVRVEYDLACPMVG